MKCEYANGGGSESLGVVARPLGTLGISVSAIVYAGAVVLLPVAAS